MIDYRKIDKDYIEKNFDTALRILGDYYRHQEFEDVGLKDLYFRSQVIKQSKKRIDYFHALDNIYKYNRLLHELEKLKDDDLRAKFVASITDREMKLSLLSYIQKRENRDLIINSFDRKVDEDIKDVDSLVQRMIREYFEDKVGEKMTAEKRERLELVLRGSDISFGDLTDRIKGREIEGLADFFERNVTMSTETKDKTKTLIGLLAHEYGHLFSEFNVVYTNEEPNYSTEEGMADVFADVVINHFIQKYGRIELGGKIVIEDYPFIEPTCYTTMQNFLPRTWLAGLESSGKDSEAISDYFLGKKIDFLKMIFGERKLISGIGEPESYNYIIREGTDYFYWDLDYEELYYSPILDYSNVSRKSLYYQRGNNALPLFIIQNKIKGAANVLWGLQNLEPDTNIGYVAERFFDGQSFFEVNDEAFQEFLDLIKNASTPLEDPSMILKQYMDACVDSLRSDTVKKHSFENLKKMAFIVEMMPEVHLKKEWKSVLNHTIQGERERLQNTQMTKEQISEELELLNKYIGFFSRESNEDRDILMVLKELESKCEGKKIENKSVEPVLVNKDNIAGITQGDGALLKKAAARVNVDLAPPKGKTQDQENPKWEGRTEE